MAGLSQSQFHYGSIKTGSLFLFVLVELQSQFHYGSIKTNLIRKLNGVITRLNSTMVRLKQKVSRACLIPSGTSQFHYGSIKTVESAPMELVNKASQFHYGSIKTAKGFEWFAEKISLNSTMVRLKHGGRCDSEGENESQFHYGSIKTLRSSA